MNEEQRYEREEAEKLEIVVRAALANPPSSQDIEIKTAGYQPCAITRMPAYVLAKLLKIERK